MADHLKAGKLNLAHSLRYRPFDTYLLDAAAWERQRDQLLVRTDLMYLRAGALAGRVADQAGHCLRPHLRAAGHRH